ncbi:hypothetical protein QMO56_21355 [Roseomonas sp. E05]|uniref:hypothetical protein n=1 Tax=Roseomonas sp. E05 TaxID=3046310 RepID=UPI0024B93D91|nr:hypothetical protein [Roseomonas sp. E05]MDJ0390666.1 hypothetical protein [Roseomonas sp. E05]
MSEPKAHGLTIASFLARSPPVAPKIYGHFKRPTTCSANPSTLVVNLGWLSAALRGDSGWAYTVEERNAETFKPERYLRMQLAISAEEEIPMPWLYFERGRTTVMDGRHRLYVMLDLGFTHTPIVADPEHVGPLSTLVDPDCRL